MLSGCAAVIEPCVDSELREFPLRMRDWLKNVLVTLYERDLDHNLLTEKQKLRVRIPFMSFWERADFLPNISRRTPGLKALPLNICGSLKRVKGLPGRNRKPKASGFGNDVHSFLLLGNDTQRAVCSVFQVKKIYENEKRLQAGDHSLDLLAHDFKKNYNMYIFPVHWQFGQLDQHPADG